MNIKTCSPRLNTHQSGQDVTFRLSKHEHNDDYQENINQEILKNISEQEFKKDLMSGETILSSPAKNE